MKRTWSPQARETILLPTSMRIPVLTDLETAKVSPVFLRNTLEVILIMVSEGRGRLFRRKDGKYLIYLPKSLAEDSMFPFKDMHPGARGGSDSVFVKVSFIPSAKTVHPRVIVEEWKDEDLSE